MERQYKVYGSLNGLVRDYDVVYDEINENIMIVAKDSKGNDIVYHKALRDDIITIINQFENISIINVYDNFMLNSLDELISRYNNDELIENELVLYNFILYKM